MEVEVSFGGKEYFHISADDWEGFWLMRRYVSLVIHLESTALLLPATTSSEFQRQSYSSTKTTYLIYLAASENGLPV